MLNYSGVKPKELGALYRRLGKSGVTVEQTRAGHVRMTFPDGGTEYGPLTSSDPNVHMALARGLRQRHGWRG